MLQRIRDNSSGPIAYVIVGLITLVFAVWGIGSYFTPSANPVVASVGDVEITRYQLQQAYDQRYRQLRQLMGDRFDPEMIEPQQLRRNILRGLVQQAMLDQYALEAGYRITDEALLQALSADSRFQINGEFSAERYRALLGRAGIEPAVFEARIRQDMVSQQLRASLVNSAFVSPRGVEHAYSLRHQQRKLDYLLFQAEAYRDQIQIREEEIAAYYDSHGDRYMRDARVQLAYVELDRNALNADKALKQDNLDALYEQNKALFTTPEKRVAQQIFVPINDDNAAAARERIQKIAAEIEQGAPFADVVDDVAGGVQSSDLGAVTRSELPADVGEALFSLEPGEVSSPVRAEKGWYLVKLKDVQSGQTAPFDAPEVQKRLQQMARDQWLDNRYGELADRMDALAFQAPNGLDTLAGELGLDIQTTGWITQEGGDNLGQYAAIRKAAFSDAVLKDNLNSTPIQIGTHRLVVLRVSEYQQPTQIPLEEVEADIRETLAQTKARQLAQDAALAARDKAAQGSSLTEVASGGAAELKQPGFVTRDDTTVPASIREAAFALPKPAGGAASYGIAGTGSGAVALIALRAVRSGKAGETQVDSRFVQRQRAYVAQLEYAAFVDYLNAHADVEINSNQLD